MDATDPLPSDQEAMILPLGAPMDRGRALFEGSLTGAREALSEMSSEERNHIAIWTPGHIFSANELMAEAPHHEHDALPALPTNGRPDGIIGPDG